MMLQRSRILATPAHQRFIMNLRPFSLRLSVRRSASDNNGSEASKVASKPVSPQEPVPIWVRREQERQMLEKESSGLPWGLYLLASSLTAIAAVGCIFEFIDGNAFFGLIQPDSPLWAPILLSLAVTGFPVAGFLFYKGVTGFNEDADRQDRLDGYTSRDD